MIRPSIKLQLTGGRLLPRVCVLFAAAVLCAFSCSTSGSRSGVGPAGADAATSGDEPRSCLVAERLGAGASLRYTYLCHDLNDEAVSNDICTATSTRLTEVVPDVPCEDLGYTTYCPDEDGYALHDCDLAANEGDRVAGFPEGLQPSEGGTSGDGGSIVHASGGTDGGQGAVSDGGPQQSGAMPEASYAVALGFERFVDNQGRVFKRTGNTWDLEYPGAVDLLAEYSRFSFGASACGVRWVDGTLVCWETPGRFNEYWFLNGMSNVVGLFFENAAHIQQDRIIVRRSDGSLEDYKNGSSSPGGVPGGSQQLVIDAKKILSFGAESSEIDFTYFLTATFVLSDDGKIYRCDDDTCESVLDDSYVVIDADASGALLDDGSVIRWTSPSLPVVATGPYQSFLASNGGVCGMTADKAISCEFTSLAVTEPEPSTGPFEAMGSLSAGYLGLESDGTVTTGASSGVTTLATLNLVPPRLGSCFSADKRVCSEIYDWVDASEALYQAKCIEDGGDYKPVEGCDERSTLGPPLFFCDGATFDIEGRSIKGWGYFYGNISRGTADSTCLNTAGVTAQGFGPN